MTPGQEMALGLGGFFFVMTVAFLTVWYWTGERYAKRNGCVCPWRILWGGHELPAINPSCPYHAREDGRLK